MSRIAEFIAHNFEFGDIGLGAFRSDVCCFLGSSHSGLRIIVIIFNARSLSHASVGGFLRHIIEPARATTVSVARPIVQGQLDKKVNLYIEILYKVQGDLGSRQLNFGVLTANR